MIPRKELLDMSIEELTDLLSNVLMATLLKGGEADRIIPDGFKVDCETDNFKIEPKESAREAFKIFSRQQGRTVHLFKPGEL